MTITKWDERFIALCEHLSSWSKDRSTKIACVIVGPDHDVRAIGYNGFPRGMNDDLDERHERPAKYFYTAHAEQNAFWNALNSGATVKGCTLYVPWYPCANCAQGIVQTRISRLVAVEPYWDDPRWGESFSYTKTILSEGGVQVDWFPPEKLTLPRR